jgi:hypothetical protein
MKNVFKQRMAKMLCLMVIGIMAFGFRASAGLDYYEIFLKNKLIMKRALNQPMPGEALNLGKVTANDQLVINYWQCHADDGLGRGRSIVLKDSKGGIIKEWKFADGTTSNRNMAIAIKDLVQSTKATDENQFTLYYIAKESSVQKLAVLNMTDKTLAATEKRIPEFSYLWAAGLFVAAIVTLYYRLA